jgi:subtilase family serine protease
MTGASSNSQTFAYPKSAPQGVRTYVHLPLRNSAELDRLIQQQSSKDSPTYHHWITPAQFRATYGPTFGDLQKASAALQAAGFHTTMMSQGILADAPQATVERAFGIRLLHRTQMASRAGENVAVLAASRAPVMPAALSAVHAQIAAFAPLPLMQANHERGNLQQITPQNRFGAGGPYFFDDLRQAYEYPAVNIFNGAGKTIAILAVSDFLDSDMSQYFGFEGAPVPTIVRRPVDGGSPPFVFGTGGSDEVSLDIQQAGGSAPGATIMVYQAPNASITPSFLDMYTAIVEDNIADVASASFSLCELRFTAAYNGGQDFTSLFGTFHDVFRQGNAQGITFVNSSGDDGALGCTDPTGATAIFGVDWPNPDSSVTGVGGTNLFTSVVPGSTQSTYVSENAFSDTFAPGRGVPAGLIFGSGGGKSQLFPKPLYQFFVNTHASMRAVPDVALHMGGCPGGAIVTPACLNDRSFDIAVLNGGFFGLIGTSASAPDFAGLQAVQDQVLGGRAGNANYLIYALAAVGTVGNGPIFHNNIPGNNGFASNRGYDFIVGNGTVRGAEYAFFPFGPFAGNPQSPSNP